MDILTRINWVDILVAIIVFRISYVAFQEGLSHEIFPLVGSAGVVVLSLHYYTKIANYISQNLAKAPIEVLNFLSFVILAVAFSFLFKIIKAILDKVIKVTWHPLIERFGGLIAGVARASIVASTVLIMLALLPFSYLQWSIADRSLTGMYFLRIGPMLYEKASVFLPNVLVEVAPVKRDDIIKDLTTDKSLKPAAAKKETKKNVWDEGV